MIWRRISEWSMQSDDGAFVVTRYGMGEAFAYQAICTRRGGQSLHIERVPKGDDEARRAALVRCQRACERVNGS